LASWRFNPSAFEGQRAHRDCDILPRPKRIERNDGSRRHYGMRMSRLVVAGSLGVLIGLSAVEARGRDAEERPLLVSVEVEPGGTADAAQVRRAIGAELGRPVVAVAQKEGTPGADPDLLLVSVSRDRVVLSMHRRADETVARDLPVPADRGARLRAIAWLAGNLARDQASPFLQASADFGAPPPAPEPPAAPEPAAAPQTPATEPPPVAAPPLPNSPPADSTVRAAGPAPAETPERAWSVLLAAGPGVYVERQLDFWKKAGISLQLEVVKHRPDHWIWGLGLDYGVEDGRGAGLFAQGGLEARWRRLRFDAVAGLGIESANVTESTTSISTLPDGTTQQVISTTVQSSQLAPFGRVFASASFALTPSWDLVVRGGAHRTFVDYGDNSTFRGAVGLRYNIP
jgi:hypothetical protein